MPKKIHYLFTLARCFLLKEAKVTIQTLIGLTKLLFFFNNQVPTHLDIVTQDKFKKVKMIFKYFLAKKIINLSSFASQKGIIKND